MKTLLDKKITILIIVGLLCFTISSAQMSNHLPLPKKGRFVYSLSKNLLSAAKLDYDMRHNDKVPCLTKQNTLGGTGDDYGDKLIQTRDGGFIVAGATNSTDGDFNVPVANGEDAFIAKYNRLRQLQWTKTVGGSGDDVFNDIVQTFDGGYVATGYTTSTDGTISGNRGGYDVLVVKFNSSGNMEWQKCLGGSGDDFGYGIVQTFYGGYAIAGYTSSNDGNVSGNHNTDGNSDAWLVQLRPNGNFLSQHCYGGSDFDYFSAIVTSDAGNLILHGATSSNDGDVSGNHGGQDAWVVKINLFEKITWQKTVGGSADEFPSYNIAKTTDGNIVIDGVSTSSDGDINAKSAFASFITKLNPSTGSVIWSKSYDKPNQDTGFRAGFGIFATADGGAVETGAVGAINEFPTFDVLISKFDANGKEEWYKTFGGTDFDEAEFGGYESFNGSLNVLCITSSRDGDVKKSDGGVDTWLIKLGPCGEKENDDELPVADLQSNAISISKDNIVSLSSYPNPFSSSTNISFTIPQSQKVSIQIFDGEGRLVKTIAKQLMQPGTHQLTWNAANENGTAVAKGIYYLKFNAGSYAETQKLSVIK